MFINADLNKLINTKNSSRNTLFVLILLQSLPVFYMICLFLFNFKNDSKIKIDGVFVISLLCITTLSILKDIVKERIKLLRIAIQVLNVADSTRGYYLPSYACRYSLMASNKGLKHMRISLLTNDMPYANYEIDSSLQEPVLTIALKGSSLFQKLDLSLKIPPEQ